MTLARGEAEAIAASPLEAAEAAVRECAAEAVAVAQEEQINQLGDQEYEKLCETNHPDFYGDYHAR